MKNIAHMITYRGYPELMDFRLKFEYESDSSEPWWYLSFIFGQCQYMSLVRNGIVKNYHMRYMDIKYTF
jgi:hypothetical protein